MEQNTNQSELNINRLVVKPSIYPVYADNKNRKDPIGISLEWNESKDYSASLEIIRYSNKVEMQVFSNDSDFVITLGFDPKDDNGWELVNTILGRFLSKPHPDGEKSP